MSPTCRRHVPRYLPLHPLSKPKSPSPSHRRRRIRLCHHHPPIPLSHRPPNPRRLRLSLPLRLCRRLPKRPPHRLQPRLRRPPKPHLPRRRPPSHKLRTASWPKYPFATAGIPMLWVRRFLSKLKLRMSRGESSPLVFLALPPTPATSRPVGITTSLRGASLLPTKMG